MKICLFCNLQNWFLLDLTIKEKITMSNQNNFRKSQSGVNKDFYNPYAFVGLHNWFWNLSNEELSELSMVHDAPIKDGLSGKINVEFRALTPFCVKGSNNTNVNINGKYFVPGTSLKGMIRSVFEIMTYSNIRNGIANDRYSMRDLNKNSKYELKNGKQKSGFLVLLNGKLFIQECINESYKYMGKNSGDTIETLADFKTGENIFKLKEAKDVESKYSKLSKRIIEWEDGTFSMWFFSGFMQNKKHEFLFDIPNFNKKDLLPLEELEYNDFIFVHEKENRNKSWIFWKKILKNYSSISEIATDGYSGIVPCFFRTKNDGKSVLDLGFSYLYRQPYPHTIHDLLPEKLKVDGVDLAQAVFGFVDSNNALRGRVQFGNAFVECPKQISEQTFIMGSPKPSFSPFYLEQNVSGGWLNYFSKGAVIGGYKRFLLRDSAVNGDVEKRKTTSSFFPLSADTEFSTIIRFHNLHHYELGALLAAITFCGKSDRCFHSLGYAKPFGYGKIQVVDCKTLLDTEEANNDSLIQSFFDRLYLTYGLTRNEWEKDMSDLFFIAGGIYNPKKQIRYPKMQDSQKGQYTNEFAEIKKAKFGMQDFSPKR